MQKPTRLTEVVGARTANSDTWLDTDGTRSLTTYADAHYFQPAGSSQWLPIDTTLTPDTATGRVKSTANRWSVSFGAPGAAAAMQELNIEGHIIGLTPFGANPGLQPATQGFTATYAELWHSTDAVYAVSAAGVDERLVLKSSTAPATFAFQVSGVTPIRNTGGGVDLLVDGSKVASIPPLTVDTARGPVRPATAKAAFSVVAGPGPGGRISIAVSPKWLAGLPAAAFPVVIDPTVFPTVNDTQAVSYASNGTNVNSMSVGQDPATGLTWRATAYIPIPDPTQIAPGGGQPWHLISAQLNTFMQQQTFCLNGTAYGENLQPMYFTSVPNGQALPTSSGFLGECLQADVTAWVAQHPGSGSWYGFTVDETGQWQHVANPSASIDYRYYQSPDPTYMLSPSNPTSGTAPVTISSTTPTLTAAPTNNTGQGGSWFDFKISSEAGGGGMIIDSGWITASTWAVPSGALADGMTYYVTVLDGIGTPWLPTASDYVPPAAPTVVKTLIVKQRLGAGGPSPTDTVGSVPGTTATPSQGAPSPQTSTASVTVNMVTGNLALTVNTRPLSSLAGPAGVTLNYDSIGPNGIGGAKRGLYAKYSSNGAVIGQRLDPSIDFSWPGSPMGGYGAPGPVTAEWTGNVTVPAGGPWALGGAVTGGTMSLFLASIIRL